MPGDHRLVAQHPLDLRAPGRGQDSGEHVDGEVRRQRVGAEAGDARHVVRVADDVDRQALLGARLGEVEPGVVVEHQPRRQRTLAGPCRRSPAARPSSGSSPPAPGARPGAGRRRAMSRNLPWRPTRRRQTSPWSADTGGSNVFSAENATMSRRAIGATGEPGAEVGRKRLHFGQFRHQPSVPAPANFPDLLARSIGPRASCAACPRSRVVRTARSSWTPAGNGRALRLTWHHEADVVVLSLWRDDICAGTFRLDRDRRQRLHRRAGRRDLRDAPARRRAAASTLRRSATCHEPAPSTSPRHAPARRCPAGERPLRTGRLRSDDGTPPSA